MNNIFISFETAKLANEKLFDVPCGDVYNWSGEIENSLDLTGELEFSLDDLQNSQENGHGKCYFCPTQSLLQKWLRETHNLYVNYDISPATGNWVWFVHKLKFNIDHHQMADLLDESKGHDYLSPEEALEQGLKTALQILQ